MPHGNEKAPATPGISTASQEDILEGVASPSCHKLLIGIFHNQKAKDLADFLHQIDQIFVIYSMPVTEVILISPPDC